MNSFKLITLGLIISISTGCQVVSPLFVDYNGVRRDVAKWINHQQLLSMQQKRSLVQLSKAQQQLYYIDKPSRAKISACHTKPNCAALRTPIPQRK